MRRIVSDMALYLRDLASTTRTGWDRFFFTPANPTALGLIRVLVGALGVWSLFVLGLDLRDYFGSDGWADPAVIGRMQGERQPFAWSFWFLVPDALLRPAWIFCLIILGAFTLGISSRLTAVLSWIIVVSTVRRIPIALYGFDQILSTLMLYLAISGASGQAVSVDRFLRRWREAGEAARRPRHPGQSIATRITPAESGFPSPTISANLGLRLIQLHLAFIYGMAGLAKLQGLSWWTGMALWGNMTAAEFVTRDFTTLVHWPLVLNFLTHASLALEILYPVLIWVGILRPILLAAVIFLHLGIGFVNPGLVEFGLVMITANVAFVSGDWLRRLVTGPVERQPAWRVLYDGACPRCRASMAILSAADPDRVIEPVDMTAVKVATIHPSLDTAACLKSMHVVSRAGHIKAGFDAVRAILTDLPLFWPIAFMFWWPGVAGIGRRVYNVAAANRSRDVPCTDEVCSIHSRSQTDVMKPPGTGAGQIVSPSMAARPDKV